MKLALKFFLSLLLLHASALFADALMINKSMQATTIIEYFIDDTGVTAELEIELDYLSGFRALLPDEIYQKLGYGNEPLQSRLQQFFSKQLALLDSSKNPLKAELLAIGPSRKVLRDPINGTPLPVQDEAPEIIRATLRYHFEEDEQPPDQLIFISPRVMEIGFIAYHNEVAVNDFRYLSSGFTLLLDWQDPWYSRFTAFNLLRRYNSPMSGFIYVEPFEVRKEIIARPKDLQRWIDLGLEGEAVIPVAMQGEIKQKVADFLGQHQVITVDGKEPEAILDSIHFLERTLTSSRVIDPPIPLSTDAAILGAIFVYPQKGLPQKVEMDWDLWDERVKKVPVSAVDQAGPLPSYLDPEWPTLVWENFLKSPITPSLLSIAPPVEQWKQLLAKAFPYTLLLIALALWWLFRAIRNQQPKFFSAAVAGIAIAVCLVSVLLGESNKPDPERAKLIVSKLLHNIYRAFDYRDEGDIYDVLDQSVTGELLTTIYLETKRSLVLANQGGAQAKVQDVVLQSLELKPLTEEDLATVEANWIVNGSVGHWGHIHQRSNRYQALLTISVDQKKWKLHEMTVLQEERL